MRLTVAIQAHPSREAMVERTLSDLALGAGWPCTVVWDRGRGPWDTARRAWEAAGDSGYHLVLQDDAVLGSRFIEDVHRALAVVPGRPPVSLFSHRSKPAREAAAAGCHWFRRRDVLWGLAIALPVEFIAPWLYWCDRNVRPDYKHDDARLALFCMDTDSPGWYMTPSLVEHGAPGDSLLGNSNRGRVAHEFVGRDPGRPVVDWSRNLDAVSTYTGMARSRYTEMLR